MKPILIYLLAVPVLAQAVYAETLTAARAIRPATVISAQDVAVIKETIPGALQSLEDVLGLESKRTLYPGHPIRPEDVGPPAVIERNQQVVLVYKSGNLTMYADARSLSRAAVGDTIRAINSASRRTISGRVMSDGTVAVGPEQKP